MKIEVSYNFDEIVNFLKENFSSPTHWPDWNLLVSKYYFTDFKYFVVYQGNEMLGICPVHELRDNNLRFLFSGQFHYIPNGGWIFSRESSISIQNIHLAFAQSLQFFTLPILPEFKVTYNAGHKNFSTLIVDLGRDVEALWAESIDSKRRNMIRKAEKAGVNVLVNPSGKMHEFYEYYESFNQTHGLKSLPFEFFNDLSQLQNIRFDFLWAVQNDTVLAITVIVYDKNYSSYWLGINPSSAQSLGQGELLQWEAIRRMKEHGCKYYDMCYIEKERLPQIAKFKSGFAKTEVPVLSFNKKANSFKIIRRIKKWF
jgi:hypothetical protein